MVLDAQRVLADEVFGQDLDGGSHHLGPALDHRFAPADHTLVGLDPAEQPAGRDEEGLDTRDLHFAWPSFASAEPSALSAPVRAADLVQVAHRLVEQGAHGVLGGVRIPVAYGVEDGPVAGHGVLAVRGAVHDAGRGGPGPTR